MKTAGEVVDAVDGSSGVGIDGKAAVAVAECEGDLIPGRVEGVGQPETHDGGGASCRDGDLLNERR